MGMEASCQCGQLRAKVAEDAESYTVLCHCTDCQRRSGSPFGVIGYFGRNAVTIVGEAGQFSRTNDSGNQVTTGFCKSCGSTVYVLLGKNEALIGIPIGAFADSEFPMPVRAVWEQRRHGWVDLPNTIMRFERGADGK
jgi:hypothetical protein